MSNISVNYCGLELRSPIIAASAGITETVERLKRVEENGAGAAVMKSFFAEEVCRQSPTPRFRILHHDLGNLRTFTLYSYEQASEFGPERYAEEVARAKRELSIPIIASISCLTDEQWVRYGRLMEEAGADALELNLSCPHGPLLMAGRDVPREMVETARLVKTQVRIPVIPKMTPMMTDPLSVAIMLERAGADGLVVFNRFTGVDIDVETEKPIMHGGYAGHGGPWSIHYPLRWITAIYPAVKIPISGSGGVANAQDVVKYVLAGATTVQVCTAIILRGYSVLRRLNAGLVEWMERKDYSALGEFRGRAASQVVPMHQVDRRHTLRAVITPDLCNGCSLCARVCIYDAAVQVDENRKYRITAACDGCGLCPQLCPTEAITMVGR